MIFVQHYNRPNCPLRTLSQLDANQADTESEDLPSSRIHTERECTAMARRPKTGSSRALTLRCPWTRRSSPGSTGWTSCPCWTRSRKWNCSQWCWPRWSQMCARPVPQGLQSRACTGRTRSSKHIRRPSQCLRAGTLSAWSCRPRPSPKATNPGSCTPQSTLRLSACPTTPLKPASSRCWTNPSLKNCRWPAEARIRVRVVNQTACCLAIRGWTDCPTPFRDWFGPVVAIWCVAAVRLPNYVHSGHCYILPSESTLK